MDTVISPSEVESQPDSYDPSWCRNRTMSKSQIHNWRNLTVNQAGDTVFCPSCKSFLNIAGWFGGIECTRKGESRQTFRDSQGQSMQVLTDTDNAGGKHKVNPRNHTLGEEGIQSRCTIRRCKRPTSRLFLNEYQYQAPYSEEDLSGDEGPASVDTAENDSDHPVEPCEPGTHKLSTGRGTAHGRKDHNPATGSFIVTPRAILTCLTCGLAEVPIYSYETMRCPSEGPKNSGDARKSSSSSALRKTVAASAWMEA